MNTKVQIRYKGLFGDLFIDELKTRWRVSFKAYSHAFPSFIDVVVLKSYCNSLDSVVQLFCDE